MASSLSLTVLYQFYPIGNTTAVCLTRDLPPDVPANVLLLPCSDPRNILYTLFCEKQNRLRKGLDFTCCDHDPGVLARNVLLFTMIIDRIATPTMWNIFFHMYIDIESRSILMSQSQKLAAYDSVEAWRSSPYGAVIKMGTDHMFAELRRHWELYADFYHPSKLDRLQALQHMMDCRLREEAAVAPKDNLLCISSSGLLFLHSQASSLFSELHRHYWETGTTVMNKTKLAVSTHPNSTFFYSRVGEGFHVPSNMDPMVSFASDPLFGNAGARPLAIEDLVDFAQSRFSAWCTAFQSAIKTQKPPTALIAVRFILGDALTVACTLREFPDNRRYGAVQGHPFAASRIAPWSALPMELNREEYADLGSPLRFDVIDTSNIIDYLGLFNLFLAAAPLLTRSSSSVLYTESFELLSSDPSIEFEATLFASLSVVAVLMDLAPMDVLSGFTTACNMHEIAITFLHSKTKDVHQQRFTWKRPSSCDPLAYPDGGPRVPVSFDTHQLAKLLHNIYFDMFRSEDPIQVPAIKKAVRGRNNVTARVLLRGIIISEEQWFDVVLAFFDMRSQDQPYFDKLRDSDVHGQLYRYDTRIVPWLDHVCHPSTEFEPGRLSFWPTIPPLIRVFLTVPCAEFAKLEHGLASTRVPFNVWMHAIIDVGYEEEPNFFQSLDVAYGTLIDTGTAAAPNLSFREDPEGYKNGADLVFSFIVPSCILTETPYAVVRLQVQYDPNTAPRLFPALGKTMYIFSANIEDTEYVHFVSELPLPLPGATQPSSSACVARPSDTVGAIGYQLPVRVEVDNAGKKITSFTAKLEITDSAAQTAFAGGAMPSVSQRSPCTIQIVMGDLMQTLAFSVPIVGSQRKVRLVRKSSYIEVVVPVAIPFLEPDGLKVNQFPVVHVNGSIVPWNVHRVFLDQLPVLNRANVSNLDLDFWYVPHLSWQPSLRERRAFSNDLTHSDSLVNVKMTINSIMTIASGLRGTSKGVFALTNRALGGTDTFLFVDKICYDDAAHAMLLDAFVLSVSDEIMPQVSKMLPYLVGYGISYASVHGREQEMCAWKQLLPALAERCRTTWVHNANCKYRVVGPDGTVRWQVPRVLPKAGDQGDPMCRCGCGKDVEGMMRDCVWRMFAPFVTRIALSPLFGVSHVEQILEPEDMPPPDTLPVVAQPGPPVASAVGSGLVAAGGGAMAAAAAAVCKRCMKQEAGDVKLLKCAGCKTVLYCSRACQKSDWKDHKSQCKA